MHYIAYTFVFLLLKKFWIKGWENQKNKEWFLKVFSRPKLVENARNSNSFHCSSTFHVKFILFFLGQITDIVINFQGI